MGSSLTHIAISPCIRPELLVGAQNNLSVLVVAKNIMKPCFFEMSLSHGEITLSQANIVLIVNNMQMICHARPVFANWSSIGELLTGAAEPSDNTFA